MDADESRLVRKGGKYFRHEASRGNRTQESAEEEMKRETRVVQYSRPELIIKLQGGAASWGRGRWLVRVTFIHSIPCDGGDFVIRVVQ